MVKTDIVINIEIKSTRKRLPPYKLSFSSFSELMASLKEKLLLAGLERGDESRLCYIDGTPVSCDSYIDRVVDHTLTVSYHNVVAPYGAKEFGRKDGLVFFFHTAEGSHLQYPHVHVRCSGEEVSIYLLTQKIVGNFSNKRMLKKAVDYVAENLDKLMLQWNEIFS